MRLGYNLSTSAAPGHDPAADARDAEALGFDFVSLSDHLHGSHPTFETWTMLTWVAAATERVGLVTNVLGLPYRPVPVLAKMAESLDRLAGGRLVLGLGAGGLDAEFEAFGLTVGTPAEKLARLDDAMDALRALWREPTVDRSGQVVLAGAQIEPKAARPVPIWVGANGPRALRLVGRAADGWIPSLPFVGPDEVPAKMAAVLAAADEAGRRRDELTLAYNVGVHVGSRVEGRPLVSGSPDEVAERLAELAGLGFDALNLWPQGDDEAAQRRSMGEEVLPRLRAVLSPGR